MTTASTTDLEPKRLQPSKQPLLGLTVVEKQLLDRIKATSARVIASTTRYYELWTDAGKADEKRWQHKVVQRLLERGYLHYRNGGYDLSEAGRVVADYLRTEQQRRKL